MNKNILHLKHLKSCSGIQIIASIVISATLVYLFTSAVDLTNGPYPYSRAKDSLRRLFYLEHASQTNPKFYPFNGTGTTVDISNKYNTSVFNSFCNNNKSLVAIAPVYSAPGNFQRRQAIRDTVGKDCESLQCRIFFIIAISPNETLNREVRDEYHKERDILIVNKIDTYKDLNNKAVAMLDWLIKYCQEPKYVIHFIDDTYPNLQNFIEHLDSMTTKRFIIGFLQSGNKPGRGDGKWDTSEYEYPYSFFPDSVAGPAYAFLNSDCQVLRDHVHTAEYCWIEDVWFTGIVAGQGAHFTFTPFKQTYRDGVPSLTQYDWPSYVVIHIVSTDNYYYIYNRKNGARQVDNATWNNKYLHSPYLFPL